MLLGLATARPNLRGIVPRMPKLILPLLALLLATLPALAQQKDDAADYPTRTVRIIPRSPWARMTAGRWSAQRRSNLQRVRRSALRSKAGGLADCW